MESSFAYSFPLFPPSPLPLAAPTAPSTVVSSTSSTGNFPQTPPSLTVCPPSTSLWTPPATSPSAYPFVHSPPSPPPPFPSLFTSMVAHSCSSPQLQPLKRSFVASVGLFRIYFNVYSVNNNPYYLGLGSYTFVHFLVMIPRSRLCTKWAVYFSFVFVNCCCKVFLVKCCCKAYISQDFVINVQCGFSRVLWVTVCLFKA